MCYSEISEIEANILFPAFFFSSEQNGKAKMVTITAMCSIPQHICLILNSEDDGV